MAEVQESYLEQDGQISVVRKDANRNKEKPKEQSPVKRLLEPRCASLKYLEPRPIEI
jgi:uncharacterized membrane protein YcaP (DUF421 family)